MKRRYDQHEVSRLTGISESQIRYWNRQGLVKNVEKEKGVLYFDFRGLTAFRTIRELLDKGLSTRKIARCLKMLKERMPDIEQPFTELRIETHGKRVIIGKDSIKFTPEGQIIIDFAPEPQKPTPLPLDADELFFQGLEYEEQGKWKEAQRRYTAVLNLRPNHVEALVHMGNIEHSLGSCSLAKSYYIKALRINPDHVEANYQLANLLEVHGELDIAMLFYYKVLNEDPEFAEAHFNLGRILEKRGDIEGAKEHWWTFLELDSTSEWVDYVKSRLF